MAEPTIGEDLFAAIQKRNGGKFVAVCKNGHKMTPDNVYVTVYPDRTVRRCKPCTIASVSRSYQRRREARRNSEAGN